MPDTPHTTSIDLLVLHTLRCIGFAGLARLAEAAGLSEEETESELIDLGVEGLVEFLRGEFGGWGLTEAGRAEDARRISEELDLAGSRTAVTEAFEDFLVLNPELLDLCTAWQMRTIDGTVTLNDHTDAPYDARVLDRLADFHGRAGVVLSALSAAMFRFDRFDARLGHALNRAQSGELEYVADGMASYHAVWFQLHEDLLATLGIPRH